MTSPMLGFRKWGYSRENKEANSRGLKAMRFMKVTI